VDKEISFFNNLYSIWNIIALGVVLPIYRLIIFVFLVCLSVDSTARGLNGRPPIVKIPIEQKSMSQAMSFTQAESGDIYVATENGVAYFDGEKWDKMTIAGDGFVRRLLIDKNRLYVGGSEEFGYLLQKQNGEWVYHSLIEYFFDEKEMSNFGDVWSILKYKGDIYFQGVDTVFRFNPQDNSTHTWHYEDKFGALYIHGDDLWLQFRQLGFKKLHGNDFVPVELNDPENLLHGLVFEVHKQAQSVLMLHTDNTLLEYKDGLVARLELPETITKDGNIPDFLVLNDEELAFVTGRGKVHVWNRVTGDINSFYVANVSLWQLEKSSQGGILAFSATSIFHVKQLSNWSVVAQGSGLSGAITKFLSWQDMWFVLTDSGVYKSVDGWSGGVGFPAFTPIEGKSTASEIWDLLPLTDDRALLASSLHLSFIDHDSEVEVLGEVVYPRVLERSRYCEELIYVGTEDGLRMYLFDNESLRLLHFSEKKHNKIESIVELGCGDVIYSSEVSGLYQTHFSLKENVLVSEKLLNKESGIDYSDGSLTSIFLWGGKVIATTDTGVFEWKLSHFEPIQSFGLDENNIDGIIEYHASPEGNLWATNQQRLFYLNKQSVWEEQQISEFFEGWLVRPYFDASGVVYWLSASSVLKFEDLLENSPESLPKVKITKVVYDNGADEKLLDLNEKFHYQPGNNTIRFSYALPDVSRLRKAQYKSRLKGFEEWTEWGRATEWTYTKLKPGEYSFEVKAKRSDSEVSEAVPFDFVIEPYWYATTWAIFVEIIVVLIIFALIIMLVVRWRLSWILAEKNRLSVMVSDRTKELESANARLRDLANKDQLTDIANRRMLDSYLDEYWGLCVEHKQPLSMIMMDLDFFKKYNDTKGHQAGDNALIAVGEILKAEYPEPDMLPGRFGGEEFVVILPFHDTQQAKARADETRQSIEDSPMGISVSIGFVSQVPDDSMTVSQWFMAADKALYKAKEQGRNQVVIGTLKL